MTKDIRMPIDVYHAILAEKTEWNCSILEAADRVELRRSSLASVRLPARLPADLRPRGYADYGPAQNGPER